MRAILLSALVVLAGCGELKTPTSPGSGGEPIDPSATFTRVQNEIFTPSCATAGCHHLIGRQAQLDLSQGVAYATIVGQPSVQMPSLLRIAPGSPEQSYLYRKITGAGITGSRMPLGAPPLDESKIRLVRDWIRRGAPND